MLVRRAAAALLIALAGAVPATAATPVLGRSALTAEQMAAYYESVGADARIALPVRNLAELFVQEGDAQGVRGDIAFAQSMIETGYLRFGGLVDPGDNNYSGLGACDSCSGGARFESPRIGVRAQIQHLFAYARPGATVAMLTRPLADPRFGRVSPTGRAPDWEDMGGGNWATDPAYSGKVLGVYRRMLAHAGLPAGVTPGASTGPPPGPLGVVVDRRGGARLAGARASRPLSDAATVLGPPDERAVQGATCLARWRSLGATIRFEAAGGDPCASDASKVRVASLDGTRWRTARGLSVGDDAARVRELYPGARRRGDRWVLIARPGGAPVLSARVRDGRVRALLVLPGTPG